MANRYKHRSQIDIFFSILEFVRKEGTAGKTRILYASNLNSRSLEKFVGHLVKIGALHVIDSNGYSRYTLTPRGYKLLSLLSKLKEILESKYVSSQELLGNKRITKMIKDKLKPSSPIILKYNVVIFGRSELEYKVDIINSNNDSYIVLHIGAGSSKEEMVQTISKALLMLIDTDKKCLLLIDEKYHYFKHIFQNVMNMANVNDDRYKILVLESNKYV